jgi:DNA segregation ATPase FtsK/SpoIIIE-like protein
VQKNNRELEVIAQECILAAIRDSIPTESIIRAYMDEAIEQEEEIIIENIEDTEPAEKEKNIEETSAETKPNSDEEIPSVVPSIKNIDEEVVTTRLTFNNMDTVLDNNMKKEIEVPKSLERLEEISTSSAIQRKLEEEPDEEKIQIYQDQPFDLSDFDILDEVRPRKQSDDFLLDDVEEL